MLLGSCKKNSDDSVVEPSNLKVDINIVNENSGIVEINATADNTQEFRLYIDSQPEPVEVNNTGVFQYTFTVKGNHKIEVRAYGETGRYINVIRDLQIGNTEIPLDKGFTSPESYPGMQLVWRDEFEGSSVNADFWSFEIGNGCPNVCGWGNNELEYYKRENASVQGGTLIIEARKENWQGSSYTSSRMVTRNKKSFQYGRIDIRALLPVGQGLWPALWMLGDNFTSVGWPASGEIDIMEMVGGSGREKTVHGVLHWDNNGHVEAGGQYTKPSGIFADEYHVFSLIWNESSIRWLVNNQQFHVIDITPSHMTEYHQPFFFIFNVAVGGRWPGNPDATTVFPQQMKVDYVRVFQ